MAVMEKIEIEKKERKKEKVTKHHAASEVPLVITQATLLMTFHFFVQLLIKVHCDSDIRVRARQQYHL